MADPPAGSVAPARPLADPSVGAVVLMRLRVGLGDLLASVPALRALRAARPRLHVALVTWEEVWPVLDRQAAYVDELIPFPGHPGIPERPVRPHLVAHFVKSMRGRRFDLAVQMYGGLPAANEVTELIGARRSAGFFTPGRWQADLSTHLPYPQRAHEVDRHLMLMEFLGVPGGSRGLEFPLWPDDERERDRLLSEHRLEPGEYVCIHPGSTAASRRWPPHRFAATADALAAEGLKVVLIGVTGERRLVGEVAGAMRAPAIDLCGRTSLGGLAAVLAGAALLVANESGPAQLAVALAVPSITLFFAGDPRRWRPSDERRHAVLTSGAPCQPCGHLECPIDFRCARDLAVADVVSSARSVLSHTRG